MSRCCDPPATADRHRLRHSAPGYLAFVCPRVYDNDMSPSEHTGERPDAVPLFVDLDGTLVATDTTVECCFRLVRRNAAYALRLPLWLLRGIAHLKRRVADRVPLQPDHLPYHRDVVAFLKREHESGRRLILATAADQRYARAVAGHLGCFEQAVGSDGVIDLSGPRKLAKLQEMSGGGPFDYAGDDLADLAIFPHARRAIVANPVPPVRLATQRMGNVERVFDARPRRILDALRMLNVQRWPLNLLVLLPAALAGGWPPGGWIDGMIAVLCFCLGASAIHIYSDLLNIAERRKLPPAQRGPIAEGRVAIQRAAVAILLVAIPAFAIAAWLSGPFLLILAGAFAFAVLAAQDWFKAPRIAITSILNLLRLVAGIALLPAVPPVWVWIAVMLAALVAGAVQVRLGGEAARFL